ncbi:MAG: hypothetical protein ACRD35_06775 [Candidatus Acidiferrales bacterium]
MATRGGSPHTSVPPNFEENLKHLTVNLKETDRYLVHARLPQDTLEGFSEAVDQVRTTVWAVLNSVVDEFSTSEQATALLTSHRIQRTQALINAITGEIDAGQITRTTPGVSELFTALGVTYKKLHYVVMGKPLVVQGN